MGNYPFCQLRWHRMERGNRLETMDQSRLISAVYFVESDADAVSFVASA